MVRNVIVLGGGTAGLTVALTLKIRLPELTVRVIRSPDIGVIGVGEGTNVTFIQHFFEYLRLDLREFHRLTEPTWKLGIRFLWGPRPEFYYPFAVEHTARWPGLSRMNAYFEDADTLWTGPVSAMMAHDKAFGRRADGSPAWHNTYAFHVENKKLVSGLETLCTRAGVTINDGTMKHAERGDGGITALHLESGERVTADLFVDASGFRSELLGRALESRTRVSNNPCSATAP
jgi:tryptophan halogenase